MSSLKRKSSPDDEPTSSVIRTPTKKRRRVQPATASAAAGPSAPSSYALSSAATLEGPSSSQSSPRKGKKKQDPDAPPVEKRVARFKPTCPQNIMDRVDRVMSQRFFMIDRHRTPEALQEVFSVLGSTGNVYTVTIDTLPSCDCPDASKGNHCKHILFIFLKVLQVPQKSNLWYQKALLSSELQGIFDQAPKAPNDVAQAKVREAYARATGKATEASTSTSSSSTKKRIPGPEDDCPICYESMDGANDTTLSFCEECGNALHKECFRQWQASSAREGKRLTCVWCRADWVSPGAAGSGHAGTETSEGYLNLGRVSGASPITRDLVDGVIGLGIVESFLEKQMPFLDFISASIV